MQQQHDFRFEVKQVDAAGSFEGLAAVYNNIDLGGDRILPGAFTKTLQERGVDIPVLWSHDTSTPIALGSLSDSMDGLRLKAQLDLDTQAGKDAHSRLQKRIVRGLSIGYRAKDFAYEDGGDVRVLKAVDLFEVSLVAIPMNPQAQVTAVKSGIKSQSDFERALRDMGFSKREARALSNNGYKGLSSADEDEEEAELLAFLRQVNGRKR